MANIIGMGSLYLDGCPAEIGSKYNPGQAISIGETAQGKEIHWVVVNDMLIADRCILTEVSWDDLDAQSLVFGKGVSIGGFSFTARLLQVGTKEDAPNEWDSALDTVGEDNSLWHWEDMFFWGQEAATGTASSGSIPNSPETTHSPGCFLIFLVSARQTQLIGADPNSMRGTARQPHDDHIALLGIILPQDGVFFFSP